MYVKDEDSYTIDPHFNLFYSYSLGGKKKNNEEDETDINIQKDKERLKILEDNLTRAFLITLKSFRSESIDYLNLLFKEDHLKIKKSKIIYFDLQNVNEELLEKIRNKKTKKILLVISKIKHEINANELKKLILQNPSQGSRPDGWIIIGDWVILIESKINYNQVDIAQLTRHINKQFGGKNIIGDNFWYVPRSWEQILEPMHKMKLNEPQQKNNQIRKYLINDFREVLMKTGQNLDLSFITNGKGYNRIDAKQQFKPLLEKLDNKVEMQFPFLTRACRPLAGYIWDYYGTKSESGIIPKDHHYSVYFDEDGAGISLTITQLRRKNNQFEIILNEIFNKIIERMFVGKNKLDTVSISRYYLRLVNYKLIDRLLDPRRKSRRGKNLTTFEFELNLSMFKRVNHRNFTNKFNKIKNQLLELKNYSKQFEFGIRILYPQPGYISNKEDAIRNSNKEFFNDSEKLLKMYMDFIKITSKIYKDIVPSKIKA